MKTSEEKIILDILEINSRENLVWFGHIKRRNDDYIGKRMLRLNLQEKMA